MSDDLARLFLPQRPGTAAQTFMGAVCTAWDAVTYANTVQAGSVVFTNLPVIQPAGMATGLVLLATTPGGPIVLGPIYQATV